MQKLIMFALKNARGRIVPESISTTERQAWRRGPDLPSKLRATGWTIVRVEVRCE